MCNIILLCNSNDIIVILMILLMWKCIISNNINV